MPQYVMFYLGGDQPSPPEEGKHHFERYKQWLDSLGDAVISPANPLKDTHTVTPDGSVTTGGLTSISGFTIVEAESIKAALSMTKQCPFLEVNGTLEVSQLIQMPLDM